MDHRRVWESLALPAWTTQPRTVDDRGIAPSDVGGPAIVKRGTTAVSWLEVAPPRHQGYVVVENGQATAINLEIHKLVPAPMNTPRRIPRP